MIDIRGLDTKRDSPPPEWLLNMATHFEPDALKERVVRIDCLAESTLDGWGCELSYYQPRFLLAFAQTTTGQWISNIEPIPDLRQSRTMTIHLPPPDPPIPPLTLCRTPKPAY